MQAEIDPDIQVLISELNKLGLKTMFSCQGDEEKSAYVTFDITKIRNFQIMVDPGSVTIYWDRFGTLPEDGVPRERVNADI